MKILIVVLLKLIHEQDKIIAWIEENKTTDWSNGLRFVQWQKNTCVNRNIGRSPFEALYCRPPEIGLQRFQLPCKVLKNLENEEDLLAIIGETSEVQKEKTLEEKLNETESMCQVYESVTSVKLILCAKCSANVHEECADKDFCLKCAHHLEAENIRFVND